MWLPFSLTIPCVCLVGVGLEAPERYPALPQASRQHTAASAASASAGAGAAVSASQGGAAARSLRAVVSDAAVAAAAEAARCGSLRSLRQLVCGRGGPDPLEQEESALRYPLPLHTPQPQSQPQSEPQLQCDSSAAAAPGHTGADSVAADTASAPSATGVGPGGALLVYQSGPKYLMWGMTLRNTGTFLRCLGYSELSRRLRGDRRRTKRKYELYYKISDARDAFAESKLGGWLLKARM